MRNFEIYKILFLLVFVMAIRKGHCQLQIDEELKTFLGTLEQYEQTANEVIFVLDESGSIGAANFPQVKNFTQLTARQLSVSPDTSRVAVITFATEPREHIDYIKNSKGKNMCTLIRDIDAIDYVGEWTHTDKALKLSNELFKNARPNANRILILVSDGRSNGNESPIGIAENMKRDGVIIFAVGVADVNQAELEAIATSRSHIYILRDFAYIYEINKYLREAFKEVTWDYAPERSLCNSFCSAGSDCCDAHADCYCGTKGGFYQCVCGTGYSGNGHKGECRKCSKGTYKSKVGSEPCTPCPANSVTDKDGSTSITSCRCKLGYEGNPETGSPCKPVQCAKLSSPEGGVLLPNQCENTFSSQCSFKCKKGYCPYNCKQSMAESNSVLPWNVLPGEPRVCLETGLWSGTDFHCEKIRCPALNYPTNGNHNCTGLQEQFTFDTVCRLECEKGYNLVGSKVRTCQISGAWSGEETVCSAVKCKSLKTSEKLKVKPKVCGSEEMTYRSTCQYYCKKGFLLTSYITNSTDIGTRTCQDNGKWAGEKERITCKDDSRPEIKCPTDILPVPTDLHLPTALINWKLPEASDNVEVKEVKVTHPSDVYKPPHSFPIGSTKVVYQATDSSGLNNTCSFTVTVVDLEPPQVRSCPDDVTVPHFKKEQIPVHWQEPVFVDNSGIIAHQSSNRKSGDKFIWGPSSLVSYEASDAANNQATCVFKVKVKPYPCDYVEPPVNGFLTCDMWMDGVLCSVFCNGGYQFVERPEEAYFCMQTTLKWNRLPGTGRGRGPFKLPWPDCARIENPAAVNVAVNLAFNVTDCSQSNEELQKLKEAFIAQLKKSTKHLPDMCSEKHGCDPKNVNVTCGKVGEPRARGKREAEFIFDVSTTSHHVSRRSTDSAVLHISFSFDVPEEQTNTIYNSTCESCKAPENNITGGVDPVSTIVERMKDNLTTIAVDTFGITPTSLPQITYDVLKICHMGQMLINNTCVNCPVGTYYQNNSGVCAECPIGFYQNDEGAFECKECANGTSTLQARSKSIADCKAPCKAGTFSSTGVDPCVSCPLNTYQDKASATECIPCPKGLRTWTIGSQSSSDCSRVCPPGSFSPTGHHPCARCPLGSYQPDIRQMSCIECPENQTTTKEGAHIPQYCRVVDFCQSRPCFGGSTCVNHPRDYECLCADGWVGKNCEIDVDDCSSDICYNNGTCIDQLNNFTCICMPGFTGLQCQININDCTTNTCQNGGKCVDLVNDYNCSCPDGFGGKNCEINFNECLPSPCQNGGTCFDKKNDYRCCCPTGYTGRNCEMEENYCDRSPCLNGGTCIPKLRGYECSCSVGFAGDVCEIDIDDCRADLCLNGGTCVDQVGHASCVCPPFFGGSQCEQELDSDFEVAFLSPLTSDFVDFHNAKPLRAVTVSFYMKVASVDDKNQGTPVSYSYWDPVRDIIEDNALTLMDPSQLVLYIHGQSFHTKYAANSDANWHSYVVTWNSLNGEWFFYVDAQLIANSTGVGKDGYMWPGEFVLGQEQDTVGGSFSINEAFVGSITQFNVWDYVLPDDEIKRLSSSCGFVGNLISWPYAKLHAHGSLVISDASSWCSGHGKCSNQSCHCISSEKTTEFCKRSVSSCDPNPCANNQWCNDSGEAPFCDCKSGYDGKFCQYDIDECLINNGDCSHTCLNVPGSYLCTCPQGMSLMEDGRTCKDSSYCKVNSQIFLDGETWNFSCHQCQCRAGDVFCEDVFCPNLVCKMNETKVYLPGKCCDQCIAQSPVCSIWPNGTFVTFDAMAYEFEGNCRYTLLEDCIDGDFGVQLEPVRNDTGKSLLIVHVNCVKVSIYLEGTVLVNERAVQLPFNNSEISIRMEESLIVWSQQGMYLEWDLSGLITVTMPQSFEKHVCGLCGNFNGDPFDDKVTRQKLPARTASEFIHSWQVEGYKYCHAMEMKLNVPPAQLPNAIQPAKNSKSKTSGMSSAMLHCGGVHTNAFRKAVKVCNVFRSKSFQRCHRAVDPEYYHTLCLHDACYCKANQRCYCDAIVSYVNECKRKNIHIKKWNFSTACGLQCSGGKVYNDCGPPCPVTCGNYTTPDVKCLTSQCVPGCHCPADMVLNNEVCIPVTYCLA